MYSSACQTSLLSTNAVSEVHLASLGNLRDGGCWPARVMSQFLIDIIKKRGNGVNSEGRRTSEANRNMLRGINCKTLASKNLMYTMRRKQFIYFPFQIHILWGLMTWTGDLDSRKKKKHFRKCRYLILMHVCTWKRNIPVSSTAVRIKRSLKHYSRCIYKVHIVKIEI